MLDELALQVSLERLVCGDNTVAALKNALGVDKLEVVILEDVEEYFRFMGSGS